MLGDGGRANNDDGYKRCRRAMWRQRSDWKATEKQCISWKKISSL